MEVLKAREVEDEALANAREVVPGRRNDISILRITSSDGARIGDGDGWDEEQGEGDAADQGSRAFPGSAARLPFSFSTDIGRRIWAARLCRNRKSCFRLQRAYIIESKPTKVWPTVTCRPRVEYRRAAPSVQALCWCWSLSAAAGRAAPFRRRRSGPLHDIGQVSLSLLELAAPCNTSPFAHHQTATLSELHLPFSAWRPVTSPCRFCRETRRRCRFTVARPR